MSLLIRLRHRLKTIETIKKVTHAMRLIAMSNHSSLKHKEQALEIYQKTISSLLLRIQTVAPEKSNFFVNVDQSQATKNLIILAGSQKGLCGNFNAALFQFFDLE